MSFLPPSAKLSNPTHKIVGPDGTEYFLIARRGNTLRIRILFEAPNWVDMTPAGSVSQGWGPSGADDILMGRWIGILAHHFTGKALDLLPEGTHCVEVNPDASDYDYMTAVIWKGWEAAGMARYPAVALSRAGCRRFGSMDNLPVTRPQVAEARAAILAHIAALKDGSYRRADGSPVPADILPEFLKDAETTLAYLDFLDSIPAMPERPRKTVAAA